jgi:hypothetical protein
MFEKIISASKMLAKYDLTCISDFENMKAIIISEIKKVMNSIGMKRIIFPRRCKLLPSYLCNVALKFHSSPQALCKLQACNFSWCPSLLVS